MEDLVIKTQHVEHTKKREIRADRDVLLWCLYESVWEVGELVFPDVASAQDAHHVLPLQLGYLVANDGSESSRARRLHHQSRPEEGGNRRLDLLVVYQDNPLHVTLTQLERQCTWDAEQGRNENSSFVVVFFNTCQSQSVCSSLHFITAS